MNKLFVTLVYNSASGGGLSLQELSNLCTRHAISVERTVPIGGDLAHQLRDSIASGATIATVGGDGTISAVASLVAGTDAVLLPLPGGTFNNFTKDMDVPQDMDEALRHAVGATPRYIDIASVNDMFFVNNSSIGLYPQSLRIREKLENRLGKWLAAAIGAWSALVHFRNYSITIGDETFSTPFVFVGNNNYKLESLQNLGRNRLDEGLLSIYTIKTPTRWGLVKLSFAALFGRLHVEESLEYRTAKTLIIRSLKHRKVHVSHDGELSTLTLPLTYQIHAGKLRVRA